MIFVSLILNDLKGSRQTFSQNEINSQLIKTFNQWLKEEGQNSQNFRRKILRGKI
jgi:hypothetical protein